MSVLISAILLLSQPPAGTLPAAAKPSARDDFWVQQHEYQKAQLANKRVDLVFLGDSITEGWNGKGRRVWQSFYARRNAVNLGLSGDRTQHVLWRLNDGLLSAVSPKLIVVMIGTNNSANDSPADIHSGTTAIVEKLRMQLPETKILLLGIFPRGNSANDSRRIVNQRTNKMVSKLADDKHVFYLDIGSNFLGRNGNIPQQIMHDSVHLTRTGYALWAKSMERKLRELLKEKKMEKPKR